VQLGSFGNQKNVNELLQKLEKAGYRSFSRKVQTSAGRLTKVFVGPELDKEKLDLALPHLKETTGLTGKITTFDVVSD
jgi:DedD protein